MRDAVPFLVAISPFALVYGVAVADSEIDDVLGLSASWLVLAGAAQLSLLDSFAAGSSAGLAIATALMINLRFALYSAALAPTYATFPLAQRLWLQYGMTDQAAALALADFESDRDSSQRLAYAMTATTAVVFTWWAMTIIGATLGATIPESIDIGFAMPLMFLLLALPALKDKPSVLAGAVAATVAVVSKDLPQGANIVVGGLAGIAAGAVAQERGR